MDMTTNQDMKDTVMATDYYSGDSSSFYTRSDGFYKTMITTSMTTSEAANANGRAGVRFYRVGEGTICLDNKADISGAGYGIRASHNGMGILGISNEGAITNAVQDGISAIRSGNGHINISSSGGEISANVAGIYAKHGNEGDINIENSSRITVTSTNASMGSDGIEVKHTEDGNINIKSSSSINARDDGIHALHTGTGNKNIGITLRSGSNVVTGERGIYAKRAGGGSGQIKIVLEGGASVSHATLSQEHRGIEVRHEGDGLVDIDIDTSSERVRGSMERNVQSRGKGILVERQGAGDVEVDIGGAVWGWKHGVWIKHNGTGDVGIVAREKSWIYGEWHSGIYVNHVGGGEVAIDIEGESGDSQGTGSNRSREGVEANNGDGIQVTTTGDKNIDIDVSGKVSSRNGTAINANHNGSGAIDIDITGQGEVSSNGGRAIFANHNGSGAIDIDITGQGEVSSIRNTAIEVLRLAGGSTAINISGEVSSRDDTVVQVAHLIGNESITIDVSGSVSSGSGNDDHAVKMQSDGTKTLILRPGFSLGGTGKVASSGNGDSILKLTANEPGVTSIATPNAVHLDKLSGFKSFIREGGDAWTVTGNSLSRFESVDLKGGTGTLRFLNAGFLMARNVFLTVPGTLEIEGTNTLEGGLINHEGSKIVFKNGSTLRVDGPYDGFGQLIFQLGQGGDGGWETQGLTINGRVRDITVNNRPILISIQSRTGLQLGSDNSPWLVQHVHPVQASQNREDIFSFGVMVDEEIKESAVVTTERNDKEVTIGTNVYVSDFEHDPSTNTSRWRLLWNRIAASASPPVNLPQVAIRPPEVRVERNGPNDGLGFRDDVRGHAGGLWVEQGNSRILQEAGGVADGRLRTESDGVRLGFDLPAQGFMGGDVALGAGVRQEFSVSDISSQEGGSVIGIESNAALLTASWWSPAGFYVDGQAQYVRFSSDISADGLSLVQDNEGTGMGISSELGYRFVVPLGGMDFEIVPQVQLAWSRVGFEDYVGPRGGLIVLEDGDLMTGRLGLSWNGEWRDIGGSGHIYGGVSLHDPLDGRTAVRATGVLLTNKQSSSVDGRFGLSYEWDDGYLVYGEAKALRQGDVEEVSANLGMRVDF